MLEDSWNDVWYFHPTSIIWNVAPGTMHFKGHLSIYHEGTSCGNGVPLQASLLGPYLWCDLGRQSDYHVKYLLAALQFHNVYNSSLHFRGWFFSHLMISMAWFVYSNVIWIISTMPLQDPLQKKHKPWFWSIVLLMEIDENRFILWYQNVSFQKKNLAKHQVNPTPSKWLVPLLIYLSGKPWKLQPSGCPGAW